MAAQMAARPLGLSLQIEEADPVLNYKLNNYRDYLKARAEAALRPPRTVVGAALNYRQQLEALGEAAHAPPYQRPPQAPVLYIKPANTHAQDGDAILVPADVAEVQVGACLGIVFGRTATRVSAAQALDYVAGYRVVADLSEPHASYFRPALKQQCRDGFCPIGRDLTPAASVANPDALDIEVLVDGQTAQRHHRRPGPPGGAADRRCDRLHELRAGRHPARGRTCRRAAPAGRPALRDPHRRRRLAGQPPAGGLNPSLSDPP